MRCLLAPMLLVAAGLAQEPSQPRGGGGLTANTGASPAKPIQWIDVHNHFYPDNFVHADFRNSVRAALAQMDRAGIRMKILLPPPPGIRPDERFLKACQQACQSHQDRFAFGACADLNEMIQNTSNVTSAVRRGFEQKAEAIIRQGACSFGELFLSHLLAPEGAKPLCFGVEPDHPLLLLLADVAARRCAECHAGGKYPREVWTRITKPELNRFRLAPLAKTAGGTGACGKAIFSDANDPDYQKILRAFDTVIAMLKDRPRDDMPGSKPDELVCRDTQ